MRQTFDRLLAPVALASISLFALTSHAFGEVAANRDYLDHLQVELSSFVGGGQANEGATVKQASGLDLGISKPFQISQRWAVGPYLQASSHSVRLSTDLPSHARLGTAVDFRGISLGGTLGYITPVNWAAAPVVFFKGGAGALSSRVLVDRSEQDRYAQASYSGLRGRVITQSFGVLLPVSEAFHVELAANQMHYLLPLGDATSSTDVEEVKEGTTLRFTTEEDHSMTGLPEDLNVYVQALSLGVGVTF